MNTSRYLVGAALLCVAATAGATDLFKPATYQPYTSDLRPRHVGDLITVMVYESASASTTANTSAGRDASVGWETRLPGKGYTGALKTNNQMDGGGRTAREGKVLAQITVAIREITERGDLVVAGEQQLDINDERQRIRVEGRVRAQDVSDANVVLSTRIADARISYIGQGDLANVQRPAWWQRFLTLFGL
ncbi:flagellar L-ring protein precursor FlgH [Massilia sp. PDC64]|nr:flagellar basal body L-ring protein FlgH [Massilia sp. PDC64]SDF64433.1 flagellar L-ring protein precursor FlgH [Massilia sp. PDC64]